MKKINKLFALLLAAITLAFFGACSRPLVKTDENSVLVTIDKKVMEITEDTVLLDYMKKLQEKGEITFETSGSGDMIMIVSFNGKAQSTIENKYWMLYTDDAENGDATWGTCEHDGKVYNSAKSGAALLHVKEGATYIWVLQEVSW